MPKKHSKFRKSECPNFRCTTDCGECQKLRGIGYEQALYWVYNMMVENNKLSKLPLYHQTGTNVMPAIKAELEAIEREKFDEI